MGITNTRLNLENQVARYKGERDATAAQVARIEASIESLPALKARVAHLDSLITAAELLVRESNPDWSADEVKPLRKTDRDSPIPYGMMGRSALEVLRLGPLEGMRTREIARELLVRFDLDATDRKLLDKVANSLGNYLKTHDGDLVESDGERLYKRWKLIRAI